MGLRVEYILLVALAVLFGFIFMEMPSDVKASESNSTKEIYFRNLSLLDLNENGVENQLISSSVIKYRDSFEFKDINATYQKTHTVLARKAVYRDKILYLEDNISLKRGDDFSFVSDELIYNIESKIVYTDSSFTLDMNGSKVSAEKLYYNLDREELRADTIRATISF